jgi:Integrase zinc binding domain/Chromo (CHRromatin Organisation MOdifier) domain/Integrase core domain
MQVWWKGAQIVVPDDNDLKRAIITDSHSSPYGGHYGVNKTLKAIQRYFWWPNMKADVADVVSACEPCQRNKSMPVKPLGPLQPLPVPEGPWTTVSMDFIVALPTTKRGYNAILTFVDKFTKMAHFVPTTNECDAPETARLFVDHVFRYHGLPREFISDRGSQFTSRFFRELCKIWDIKQCFSTAYHPQSNGQAERMNRVVEDMIRHYVSPTQDDWDEHLPQIEFAINNAHHEGLKSTPFYMNYRRHPSTPLTVQLPTRSLSQPPEREMPKLQKFTQDQLVFLTRARRCLQAAQDRQKYYFDKNVRPVTFAVGQKVLLSTKNINLKHPGSNKLLPRWIGPFTIVEQVGPIAFKLDLPDTLQRLHPVFHASLLTKYNDKGGYKPLPSILMEDGSLEYEVERILDSRIIKRGKKRVTEYYIKWLGYDHSYDSWEPEANLHCPDLLRQFLREQSNKRTNTATTSSQPSTRSRQRKRTRD